jgi:hypothetical protein
VDKDDNIWVTDYQDNAPLPQGGRGAGQDEVLRQKDRSDPHRARPRGTKYSNSVTMENC